MHARSIRLKKLGWVTIRPLANGDTETVAAVFEQLGTDSRARRFNGAKPRLSDAELALLAKVDARRHALVAYVDGDDRPAGIAQLVRDDEQRRRAEVAFMVVDCYQGRGIGSALVTALAGDARAAGVTHLTATMQSSNKAAYALIRKVAQRIDIRHRGGEAELVASFAAA